LSTKPPKTLFLLNYKYVPDILTARAPFREGHLALAEQMRKDGKLLYAGATGEVGEGPDSAMFVMTGREFIDEFVASDPYVESGVCVEGQSIREWTVAVHDL
jgi:uncharacterized protein YciI